MYKLASCILLLVSMSLTYGCNQIQEDGEPAPSIAESKLPKQVEPLDAPNNPYKAEYSIWDERVYAALQDIVGNGSLDKATELSKGLLHRDERYRHFNSYLDNEGCLIPKLKTVELREELYKRGSRSRKLDPLKDFHHIIVPVQMTDEDYELFERDAERVSARYFARIPKWIYENTPSEGAIFYPNGDVVCFGEPGSFEAAGSHTASHHGEGASAEDHEAAQLFLYDLKGNLKAKTTDAVPWKLYVGDDHWWPAAKDLIDRVEVESTRDGYYILRDRESREIAMVLDFDGTPLQEKAEPPLRDLHGFFKLSAKTIRAYYEAQQGGN